jgi:hypothetical protein
MNKTIILSIFFCSFSVKAQDNLLNLLSQDNEPIYITYLFKGTKVVNGQSVELPSKGVLQFTIQHRFGTLNSGFYNLYGLDNSQVRFGFDYGIKDFLAFGLGRSSNSKTIDANSKLIIKRQIKDGFPLTIVANSATYVKQWQYSDNQSNSFLFTNQLSFAHQLLIACKINRDFSLQISPTLIHYNVVETLDEPNDKYSLGLGGRHKITKRISVNAEYFHQLNDKINNNVLSFGFDVETGGHVFQLHFSNSALMIVPGFITKTTGNWLYGDIYFGFNISRVFTLNK